MEAPATKANAVPQSVQDLQARLRAAVGEVGPDPSSRRRASVPVSGVLSNVAQEVAEHGKTSFTPQEMSLMHEKPAGEQVSKGRSNAKAAHPHQS